MENLVLILILAIIIGGAVLYLVRAKKRGIKCVGCPDAKSCAEAKSCGGNCSGCSLSCGTNE